MSERTPRDGERVPETAECGFDELLISGFLDGALTQSDNQRVRLHLARCESCATTYEELRSIREASISTEFPVLGDDQWDETPRGGWSRLARNAGWALLLAWVVVVLALIVARPAWQESAWVERVVVLGSIVGWAALLLSAGIDRWRTRRTDVYRGVKK